MPGGMAQAMHILRARIGRMQMTKNSGTRA
jgi:hypothetical protein